MKGFRRLVSTSFACSTQLNISKEYLLSTVLLQDALKEESTRWFCSPIAKDVVEYVDKSGNERTPGRTSLQIYF